MNKTDVAYSLQQNFESRSRFKMPQKNCYFEILKVQFMSRAVWDEKFPAKKLRKNTAPKIRMRQIFFVSFK